VQISRWPGPACRAAVQVSTKDLGVAFRTGNLAAFKRWQQILFYDPEGNVIEVHQAMNA
jgi:hypothetical protein